MSQTFRAIFISSLISLAMATPVVAASINLTDLDDVAYTRGSLENPHVVRVNEPEVGYGYVAVVERVYDVGSASRLKQAQLKDLKALSAKYGAEIPEEEVVRLMTAEKTMLGNRKFKEQLRVWSAQNPKQSFLVQLTPVFYTDRPEVVDPQIFVHHDGVLLVQELPNGDTKKQFVAFKTKKLRVVAEASERDTTPDTQAGETVASETFVKDGPGFGESYAVGQYTISNTRNRQESVVAYPIGWFAHDNSGIDTESLNPLVLSLGLAGYTMSAYTRGMFVMRAGETTDLNVMGNQVPEDVSVESLAAEITRKWGDIENLEFATYQIVGFRLHR